MIHKRAHSHFPGCAVNTEINDEKLFEDHSEHKALFDLLNEFGSQEFHNPDEKKDKTHIELTPDTL